MIRFPPLIIVTFILLLAACTHRDRMPKGVYPREKMQAVLWDMLLADRYAALYLFKDSLRIDVKQETFKLYEEVFAVHNTNREAFIKSYRYYLAHPNLSKQMLDSLSNRANRNRFEQYRKYR